MDLSSLESKLAAFGGPPLTDPPPSAPVSKPKNLVVPSKTKTKKKKSTKTNNKPSTSSSSRSSPSTSASRFDQLYKAGQTQLAKKKQARKERPTGCTFSPRTNSKSKPKVKSQSRFDRLYEGAAKTRQKIASARQKKADAAGTFKPEITRKAQRMSTGKNRADRFTSLYEGAAKTRQKIANARQKKADAAGTFKPKITKRAQRSASPSPQQRFNKLYADGTRDLVSQRAKQRADRELEGCTFKPKINSRSRSSSQPRSRNTKPETSFADRLHEYGRRAEERLDRKRMEANSIRDKEATFHPNTKRSKNNRRSLGSNYNRYSGEESVEEAAKRLSQVETKEQYEKRLERRRQELAEQNGATFRPHVNKSRSRTRPQSARRSRGGGAEGDKRTSIWERLNTDSNQLNARQAAWKKEREKRELAECTFKPKIRTSTLDSKQSHSNASSNDKPVWQRLSNVNIGQEHMLRDEQKKKKELAACTFQPTLVHHRRKGTAPATTATKVPIWERLNKETKNVDELERKKTKREMQECTFSPKMSKETEEMTKFAPPDAKPVWERLFEVSTHERQVRFEEFFNFFEKKFFFFSFSDRDFYFIFFCPFLLY